MDIGLPVDEVRPLIGRAFVEPHTTGDAVVEAVNRRGRPSRVRLLCSAFRAPDGAVNGALLLLETER